MAEEPEEWGAGRQDEHSLLLLHNAETQDFRHHADFQNSSDLCAICPPNEHGERAGSVMTMLCMSERVQTSVLFPGTHADTLIGHTFPGWKSELMIHLLQSQREEGKKEGQR